MFKSYLLLEILQVIASIQSAPAPLEREVTRTEIVNTVCSKFEAPESLDCAFEVLEILEL